MQIMQIHAASMFSMLPSGKNQPISTIQLHVKIYFVKFCNNMVQNIKVFVKCAVIHDTKGQYKESTKWVWQHRRHGYL